MRLDKYLKISRIIKRRTIANDACDAGRIMVNGKSARASYAVKVGDIITVNLGSTPHEYEITAIAETVKKEDAERLYKLIK